MVETALLKKKTSFEVDPEKWARLIEKEKVKFRWGVNFKDFAISLTVFELWQFY